MRDGSQCIVILTSNVGADQLSQLWNQVKNNPNWRTEVREKLRALFKQNNFRIEFLNRVDELVLFRTLEEADYAEIADRLLKRDLERLRKERQIDVADYSNVAKAIGAYCAKISEGARAAQRLTQSVVITPVIDFVLRNSCALPVKLKIKAVSTANNLNAEPVGVVELA